MNDGVCKYFWQSNFMHIYKQILRFASWENLLGEWVSTGKIWKYEGRSALCKTEQNSESFKRTLKEKKKQIHLNSIQHGYLTSATVESGGCLLRS